MKSEEEIMEAIESLKNDRELLKIGNHKLNMLGELTKFRIESLQWVLEEGKFGDDNDEE